MSNADIINELYRQREALYNGEVNQDVLATIIDLSDLELSKDIESETKSNPIVVKIHTMAESQKEFNRSFDNIRPVKLKSFPSKFIKPTEISTGKPYTPITEIESVEKRTTITFQKTLEQAA